MVHKSPFLNVSRELGVQWIIEGDIRQKQDKIRVSLSLVDAKTALVVYSLAQDLDNDPIQLKDLSSLFVLEVLQVLDLQDYRVRWISETFCIQGNFYCHLYYCPAWPDQ